MRKCNSRANNIQIDLMVLLLIYNNQEIKRMAYSLLEGTESTNQLQLKPYLFQFRDHLYKLTALAASMIIHRSTNTPKRR